MNNRYNQYTCRVCRKPIYGQAMRQYDDGLITHVHPACMAAGEVEIVQELEHELSRLIFGNQVEAAKC